MTNANRNAAEQNGIGEPLGVLTGGRHRAGFRPRLPPLWISSRDL